MLLVSDHSQGFADRVLSNFDILFVKDKAAVKFTCTHLKIRFIHTIRAPFVKPQELSLKTPKHNGFI